MLTFPSASLRPQTVLCGIGILADCPSRMRLRLRLGPDLPRVDERCPGNLRLSVLQFLTAVFATHTGILTSSSSGRPYGRPSSKLERSPTAPLSPPLRFCASAPFIFGAVSLDR